MADPVLTVYTAAKIITMNPSQPEVVGDQGPDGGLTPAVAVSNNDGLIVEVGTLETMRPWLDAHSHDVDASLADKVILPGFIDPHLHPSMAAVLLPMHFITAMDWRLPWQTVEAIHGHDAYVDRLRQVHQEIADLSEPLFTWGYHQIWHGPMHRAILNSISNERPVICWHRSFHELYMNDAAIDHFELDRNRLATHPPGRPRSRTLLRSRAR